ncbi:MAG: hypothetical protein EYC68_06015 [Chloroflexota bacterium]|nr:MAG: hypothetical protein EYC68_06015 [Chloroflexota bacterium]
MAMGPTSVLVIQFTGRNFKGEILAALYDLVKAGTVRIVDAVAVIKDNEGKVTAQEVNQLAPTVVAIFDPLNAEVSGLISNTDIQDIGTLLDNDSAAGILVLEQLWATKLAQAITNAKGKVVLNRLLMPEVVEENMAIIEKIT